jgi:hypoxanthine-guanine phosphoribosyltransferase
LLARKAACLLSVLEDLGLISLNGIVVSERILEYNTEWLKGKKVAIMDDTIISGTSIYKIIEKLKLLAFRIFSYTLFALTNISLLMKCLKMKAVNII